MQAFMQQALDQATLRRVQHHLNVVSPIATVPLVVYVGRRFLGVYCPQLNREVLAHDEFLTGT